jgi:nucleotide-binding universal stress UspA family protein
MKTIVAGVDTSEMSRLVFREALVLASTMRAEVIVVSVTPQYEGNMNRMCIKDSEKQFNENFHQILEEAIEYAESLGLNLKTIHRTGKPSDEILAIAQEKQASLIVLGCAKRHQVERMLLGRTTAEIIDNSHCDILLLPENSEIRFSDILVGINKSFASDEAERRAFDVARSYGSKLHGVHAIDIPSDRSLRYGVARDAENEAFNILNNFVARSEAIGIPVTTATCWNTPDKGLATYAKEQGINLIILGSDDKSSFLEMLGGSVVERLASLTSCPVLIAKYRPQNQDRAFSNCAFVFEE